MNSTLIFANQLYSRRVAEARVMQEHGYSAAIVLTYLMKYAIELACYDKQKEIQFLLASHIFGLLANPFIKDILYAIPGGCDGISAILQNTIRDFVAAKGSIDKQFYQEHQALLEHVAQNYPINQKAN
jgi:hypothetical protein